MPHEVRKEDQRGLITAYTYVHLPPTHPRHPPDPYTGSATTPRHATHPNPTQTHPPTHPPRLCYRLCTQRNPFNFSRDVYGALTEAITTHLSTHVAPALLAARTAPPTTRLLELVAREAQFKYLMSELARPFRYLVRI